MDEISKLLKEAKPLYKKQKQQKTIAKMILVLSMPILVLSNAINLYIEGDNTFVALEQDSLQNELLEDDLGLLEL